MILLLLACAEPVTQDSAAPEPPIVPSAYAPDAEDLQPPEDLPTEAIEAGLEEVIRTLPLVKPRLLHDTWHNLMADYGDAACPEVSDHNGQDHWREDLCVSDAGAEFRGWSLYYRSLPPPPEQEFLIEVGWLSGQASITTPEGYRLDSFGDALHEYFVSDEGTEGNRGFVFGDFLYNDPRMADTWLQFGITLESYFSFSRREGWYQTNLDTWIAGLDNPETPAVILESFLLTDEPGRCGLEPMGEIRVRDINGVWYELFFDGPEASVDQCDGCGQAWRGERLVGEVCVDWSPLLMIWGANP
ncbi:MAG: hypothetical protein H6741_17810 [Alphaproteobacteria bacterium]|nr:hypothetical protein [Alphaproteobacteria bacterium]MCB9794576.1 hypothetical protein [Alphaproteobacteria bacterium]